jgi:hypothetical protein
MKEYITEAARVQHKQVTNFRALRHQVGAIALASANHFFLNKLLHLLN